MDDIQTEILPTAHASQVYCRGEAIR